MIEIYFDGVLIDSDYYANITNEFKLFDEEFMLGTTTANTLNIEVPYDAVDSIPLNVVIKLDGVDYATMIVDKYEIKDNNILSLSLTDKMTLLNIPYDASPIVPCTVLDILQNICLGVGLELGTTSFTNSDVFVDYYDNTITAREYVGYIAELNGGYAVIGQDGKLYLKKFNSVPVNIDIDECEDFKIGEHHVIERVVFDNGLLKFETSQDESLETLYLNSENVYINTQDVFDNIANEILGFEFYNFETGNCVINPSLLAGDLINFTDGTNNYQTIAQYSLDYYGSWMGGYSLDINSKQQQETQQTGVETKIKNIQVRLNRDENVLGIVVEESSENNSQISNLTIKTDSIESTVSSLSNETNTIEKTLTQLQTDSYTKTQIDEKLTDGSVTAVKSTVVTIDNNGQTIDKSDSPVKTNIDADGLSIIDKTGASEEILLEAKYDEAIGETRVRSKNIVVEKYLTVGTHSRIEDYETGTGIFFIG